MSNSNKSTTGGAKPQAPAAGAAPAAEDKKENGKKAKVPGIKVVSTIDGFRRGGRGWTTAPTTVALAALKKEQLELIRNEPALIVVDIEDITPAED